MNTATTDRPDDAILQKIEAMLRTAEKGKLAAENDQLSENQRAATMREAETAAAMAQTLMLKYHVSQGMLSKEESSAVGEHLIRTQTHATAYFWQADLLQGLANLNFCKVWHTYMATDGSGKDVFDRIELLGHEDDVKLVSYLFSYLFREIRRLGLAAQPKKGDYKEDTWGRQKPINSHDQWVWMVDFGKGAVITVLQRLERERKEAESNLADENVSSTAIIVARDAEVEDYYYKKTHGMTKAEYESKNKREQDAYRQGRKLGIAGGELEQSFLAQYTDEDEQSYFRMGFRSGKQSYNDELLEQKYESGELKRPKPRGPGSRGGRGYQYRGRRERDTNWQAYTSGQQAGQTLELRKGIERTGKTDAKKLAS